VDECSRLFKVIKILLLRRLHGNVGGLQLESELATIDYYGGKAVTITVSGVLTSADCLEGPFSLRFGNRVDPLLNKIGFI
jgi:hypothetical protein